MRYWWINANPDREDKDGGPWSWITSIAKDGVEQWNAEKYDEDDVKGREGLRPNFNNVKIGDLVLGYNTNKEKKIVAKGRIVNHVHRPLGGDGRRVIDIIKTEDAKHPVSLQDLKNIPQLCQFTKSRALLGTIKEIHATQYKMLVDMMDKEE
ncbi:EVE domain-containing protein [Clostridium sp.]|uniref:EVE domain-containing protein n=1 Tax=Clostridium sp. TaxID=1506 RepID=UPI003D6D4948